MTRSTSRFAARAVSLAAFALVSLSAVAAPSVGPSGMSFYDAPATLSGNHGDLISYRSAAVSLGAGAPAVNAWNVLYQSTDALGKANAVTGTVIVPSAAWMGSGSRPTILYAVGTHGLAQKCAPSQQLAAGKDYETANIVAALKAGYAVIVTDYAGYTNGSTPSYLVGASQGHALLDSFKAATQLPGSGVSASTKVGIWGYSQGGQTAAWAGEQVSAYAPDIKLSGIAAGGVPANFKASATNLDGSAGEFFLLGGVIGLAEQYPDAIPINELANANGQVALARGKNECVFEGLFDFMNHRLSEYVVGNQSLDQFMATPAISAVLDAQNLGNSKIPVPLYQYHGQADEFLPLGQAIAAKKKYCSKYSNVTFDLFPSEHIVTQFQAAPQALSWLADRFAGKITLGNCLSLTPEPKSTANPGGGNFVVSLKSWPLTASVKLKTLNQTINMPSTSTFTADTDMTAKTLKGTMSIPTFTATISLAGIPTDVKLSIVPTAPATGTATLDNDGILHVHGNAYANIKIESAGISFIQLPMGCTTSSPVVFPLNFDGPVSSLGNGNLTFSGTTTFPSLTGCGILYGPLLSALMSGAGQQFSFTVKPPAPTGW